MTAYYNDYQKKMNRVQEGGRDKVLLELSLFFIVVQYFVENPVMFVCLDYILLKFMAKKSHFFSF